MTTLDNLLRWSIGEMKMIDQSRQSTKEKVNSVLDFFSTLSKQTLRLYLISTLYIQ